MKALCIFAACFLAVASLWAGNVLVLGGGAANVNGTTNGAPFVTSASRPISGTVTVTHGALTSTNQLAINVQFTADGSNYVTLQTWTTTNLSAMQETFSTSAAILTNMIRLQTVTTSNTPITLGIQF